MIVGQTVAEVSSSPVGSGGTQCTFQHKRYATSFGDTFFNIYDTVGLNEGEQGRVPHWKAVHQLYTLIRTLDGFSLLVYCIRGRIKENARENWNLFNKVLCAKKVPIIAVETGLENVDDLEGRRNLLQNGLEKYGMVPRGIACVVSVLGKWKEYEDRYHSSQYKLRQLILRSYRKEAWSMTTDDWIDHIYQTTITTKLCLFPDVRVEFAKESGNVVDEFIEETGMKKEELVKLKSTLLHAEKEVRKVSREEH